MPKLFGPLQFRDLASRHVVPDLRDKVALVESWRRDYYEGTLRTDNETSREQAFNRDFFEVILGYSQKPLKPYTFEPKSSTDTGQQPDARIGFFDDTRGIDRTIAVVELKGAAVSLDRPQQRADNRTPVEQGFKYRPQYRGCEFVIVSNFYETRIYQDTLLDFERWTLDDLVDPADDYLSFKQFHLALSRTNFVSEFGPTKTQSFLSDIRTEQELIGKRFYSEYNAARTDLISNMQLLNPDLRVDPLTAIRHAQKVIDRVVFACFAEDRGLLPEFALQRMLRDAAESSFGSLWSTMRSFFAAIDRGSDRLNIPVGYNGGLFAFDPALDDLRIGDAPLRRIAGLGSFNFADELSVTVLGHIFEQSISDLELLRESVAVEDLEAPGPIVDPRRRRDGIYYTPDTIVRMIVDQSLGRFLRENEKRFISEARLNETIQGPTYSRREQVAYRRYQAFLRDVTVLDPACGSGAFLVGALEYLLAEHARVGEILDGELLAGDALVRDVLQHNLYGVDLNEESVEITKLSLWLRTASRNNKLVSLDRTIRAGHSLLSSGLMTSRPFDWNEAFAEIMGAGGFDVVIGNPPYVDSKVMVRSSPEERQHIADEYVTARGNWDLFVPFIQRAFDLVKRGGYCSMIVPNKVLGAPYAKRVRSYISQNGALVGLTDLSRAKVFDVNVYPVVFVAKKEQTIDPVYVQLGLDTSSGRDIERSAMNDMWSSLLEIARPNAVAPDQTLGHHFAIAAAATTSEAYELIPLLSDDPGADAMRVINTGTIDPYWTDWGLWPMRYLKSTYMSPVVSRSDLPKEKPWYGEEKVIVAGMSKRLEACYSEATQYFPATSTVILVRKSADSPDIYVALAVLNTEAFSRRFMEANSFNAMAGGYVTVNKVNLGEAEFPNFSQDELDELGVLARMVLAQKRLIREETWRLKSILIAEYGVDAWTPRFKSWWTKDFAGFSGAVGVRLSLSQKSELFEMFESMGPQVRVAEYDAQTVRDKIELIVARAFAR